MENLSDENENRNSDDSVVEEGTDDESETVDSSSDTSSDTRSDSGTI
jgi:hypothetical protein